MDSKFLITAISIHQSLICYKQILKSGKQGRQLVQKSIVTMASHLMSLERIESPALSPLISIPVCTLTQPCIREVFSILTAESKGIVVLVLGWVISKVVYNVYFHPLHSYPGPFLASAFKLYLSYLEMNGTQHIKIKQWHDTYGEVVRIGPNSLSYNSGQAWEDICGESSPQPAPPPKYLFLPLWRKKCNIDGCNI